MDVSFWVWLGCAGSLCLGAFVQRATGFGLAVIGTPLILMLEPRLVPAVLVMFGLLVAVMMVGAYRREIRLNAVGMALVGRVPGTVLGIWLLLAAPLAVLEKLIALIVLSSVAVSLLKFSVPLNRVSLFVAGIVSGIFGTVSAIGGPPIALLMHRLPADAARANLSAFFIVSAAMTLLALLLADKIQLWHLGMATTFVPAVVLGHLLASRIAHRLDRRALQWSSLILSTVAALGLLF
nr:MULTISPECIES: sulfite exporter TauE/SafE family protein [unclassified Halomonas]